MLLNKTCFVPSAYKKLENPNKISIKLAPFLFSLFCLSCGDRVSIIDPSPERPKAPETKAEASPPPPSCLKKTIDGQDICVQKKEEIFYIDHLENQVVDFLFVLDVSVSMTAVLERLGQAFESLMSSIQKMNWRILFTTADHGDHFYTEDPSTGEKIFSHQSWEDYQESEPYFGQFMYLEHRGKKIDSVSLSVNTLDYAQVFKDTLTRKTGDSCELAPYCQRAMEQPLRAHKASLERLAKGDGSATSPKLREQAPLISFIITNEDERKEDPDSATTAKELLSRFKELFPKKEFYAFGLLIPDDGSPESQECLKQQMDSSPDGRYSAVFGQKVAELPRLTKGENISLCESDYGPPLQKISQLLRSHIQSLTLKEKPLLDSLQVEFIKGEKQTSWKQDGQKLLFEQALPPHAEIKVSYLVPEP